MKPIIIEKQDEILTSEINENHIVVGIIAGRPTILYCREYSNLNTLSFLCLHDNAILGNSFENEGLNSIKEFVEFIMKKSGKIEVFHQKDWKKALQWLIDNT